MLYQLQEVTKIRNLGVKDFPLIIHYQNYDEKYYSVAANRFHPVSVFMKPQKTHFKERMLLASTDWTSSSAVWMEAYLDCNWDACGAVSRWWQTDTPEWQCDREQRQGAPSSHSYCQSDEHTGTQSVNYQQARMRWGLGRAARQFAMCYKFLSAVTILLCIAPCY